MDYLKLRKWIRFYEKEGVDAVSAIQPISFWVTRLTDFPECYEQGACADGITCTPELCPKVDLDDVK